MISSRKHQLVIALILVFTFTLALGTEPNEAKTELKIEINSENAKRLYGKIKTVLTPIRPTHVAYFAIEWYHWQPTEPNISEILQTPIGQTVSQLQRDLFRAVPAIPLMGTSRRMRASEFGSYPFGSNEYAVYAVSQEDAKKMAQALVEVLMKEADVALGPILKSYINKMLSKKQELEKNVAEIKKQISKMEAEIKNAQPNLDRLKKEIQYLHSGKAEEAISEFNKMLNTLKIELSGIRSRVQTIEIYKAKLGKEISGEHRFKLEQMFIEQMIELNAGEARKNTVIDLRNEARSFYNLDRKLDKLKSTKYNLGNDLTRLEPVLGQIEEKLTNPSPDMLPPKVYQNKVTIYPVRLD